MGIPSYFKWIVQKHRKVLIELCETTQVVDNLCIDANGTVYDSLKNIKFNNKGQFEKILISLTCDKLMTYIKQIKPTNRVIIAFDGVAPVAKLEQQRSRRFKTFFEQKIKQECGIAIHPIEWSTSNITPGTSFMNELSKRIKSYFNSQKKQLGVKEIIITTSEEAGEGEHKIFEIIRNDKSFINETTVVYGLDADLIMLTLHHLRCAPKLYLYRETPEFIKQIDNTLDPNKTYMLDIPELANAITEELNDGDNIINDTQKQRMFDYIFICFFLGNDFMPHFPSLNIRGDGINILTQAYKQTLSTHGNLTDNEGILWKNVRSFVTNLSKTERENIINEGKRRDKQSKIKLIPKNGETLQELTLMNLPLFNRNKEQYINPEEDGWRERYYDILFDIKPTDDRIQQICLNYLEGLEWTLKYYTTGCINWEWKYNYHYPPLLCDLINYIPYFKINLVEDNGSKPVDEIVQLSYVLPLNALNILPKDIHTKLLKNHPEWYVDDAKLETTYCRYLFEAHPCLPKININKLQSLISSK